MEDYFETFVRIYDEHFSRQYGFWRPYVEQVIYRDLDCGDLQRLYPCEMQRLVATNTFRHSPARIAAFDWQYSILFSLPF